MSMPLKFPSFHSQPIFTVTSLPDIFLPTGILASHGALKNQVQHFWEKMLRGQIHLTGVKRYDLMKIHQPPKR
jgi:hypothetical protein